jgi:DNA-binding NarL/FixJ family response regulator
MTSAQSRTHAAAPPGLVLSGPDLKPIYSNHAAVEILNYVIESNEAMEWDTAVQAHLQRILQTTEYSVDLQSPAPFISGRRRYLCRSFRVSTAKGNTRPPLVAILMERHSQPHAGILEMTRRFHLSPRESETVQHLTKGLTTKEIAQRMRVSPNTVKQFIRLTMTKMSVSTRSGILGKALGTAANHDQS